MERIPERNMEPPEPPQYAECVVCGGIFAYDDTRYFDDWTGKRICVWCEESFEDEAEEVLDERS